MVLYFLPMRTYTLLLAFLCMIASFTACIQVNEQLRFDLSPRPPEEGVGKQGVWQAECIEAKADDYATGEGLSNPTPATN